VHSKATAAAVAPLFRKRRGARKVAAWGRSVVTSCSKTAPVSSFTARSQIELPAAGHQIVRVSSPAVAIGNPDPRSTRVGAPVASLRTSCQFVWVPR
jgi:hypothetical protein